VYPLFHISHNPQSVCVDTQNREMHEKTTLKWRWQETFAVMESINQSLKRHKTGLSIHTT